jgi:RimJ/RimL family protein N-acetyltransferase
MIDLADVYKTSGSIETLYELLKERDDTVNISHKELPSFCYHVMFVEHRPYAKWFLIMAEGERVGSIYLSRQGEIGVFIFKAHQGKGYGTAAIKALMAQEPGHRFLANVNPANDRSADLFKGLGFKLIQHTYEVTA